MTSVSRFTPQDTKLYRPNGVVPKGGVLQGRLSTSLSLDGIVRSVLGDRPVLEPLDVSPGST